jgi:hypothetical protein
MEITTFNPQIVTKDAESVAAFFEELGFERRHNKKEIGERGVRGIRMKDANGFYLDISQPEGHDLPDAVGIRMNVRDFDAAYDLLVSRGFKNVYGDGLACEAETPYLIGEFEKDVQHRLENGVAFDTREQLDAWVLLHAGA